MAALTLAGIKNSFYAMLKSDSAGVSVRDALGAGANSVILKNELGGVLPAAPFVVVAFGSFTGEREDVRTLFPTLWLYDDSIYKWGRLNPLTALIEAVYTQESIAYCYTNYAGGIGDEFLDTALGSRPALPMRYQVRGRF